MLVKFIEQCIGLPVTDTLWYTWGMSKTFNVSRDMLEVSMMRRPDPSWVFVDSLGHEHRWYVGEHPAANYDPQARHITPTLVWIKDGEEFFEDDDEPHAVGHLECARCGQYVKPGYTSDTDRQFIPGIQRFTIDGATVSKQRYLDELAEELRQAESEGLPVPDNWRAQIATQRSAID